METCQEYMYGQLYSCHGLHLYSVYYTSIYTHGADALTKSLFWWHNELYSDSTDGGAWDSTFRRDDGHLFGWHQRRPAPAQVRIYYCSMKSAHQKAKKNEWIKREGIRNMNECCECEEKTIWIPQIIKKRRRKRSPLFFPPIIHMITYNIPNKLHSFLLLLLLLIPAGWPVFYHPLVYVYSHCYGH